jgi:hypothetical protein
MFALLMHRPLLLTRAPYPPQMQPICETLATVTQQRETSYIYAEKSSHKFIAAAVYQVTLMVTSGSGCSSTVVKRFTDNGSVPIAAFSVVDSAQLCSNLPVCQPFNRGFW